MENTNIAQAASYRWGQKVNTSQAKPSVVLASQPQVLYFQHSTKLPYFEDLDFGGTLQPKE